MLCVDLRDLLYNIEKLHYCIYYIIEPLEESTAESSFSHQEAVSEDGKIKLLVI